MDPSIFVILCGKVYLLVYVIKNCHQHSFGLQNLMSSWGVGILFSKLLWVNLLLKNQPKSKVFQKHLRQQAFCFPKLMPSWGY